MSDFETRIRKEIDELSIAVVKTGKAHEKANDEFLLAHAARSAFQRRIAKAESIHGPEGAILIDRETGQPLSPAESKRLDRRCEETQDEFTRLSTAHSQATAKLNDAQKRYENWKNVGAYWENVESNLSPKQKAIRAARAELDRVTAGR